MAKPKRTAEEVCIEYALAAQVIRDFTSVARSFTCEKMLEYNAAIESRPSNAGMLEMPEECLRALFNVKHESDGCGGDMYQDMSDEIEGEMCENCTLALKAYRDRKEARKRLGAAKRAVGIVGKRLNVAVIVG